MFVIFLKRFLPFYLIPVVEIQTTRNRIPGHPRMCIFNTGVSKTFNIQWSLPNCTKHYTKLCYLYLMKARPLCVEWSVVLSSQQHWILKFGDLGAFLDSSHEHSGSCQKCQQLHANAVWLSKLPVSVRVSICACLCSLVSLGAAWVSPFSFPFSHFHVSVWQTHLDKIERWSFS